MCCIFLVIADKRKRFQDEKKAVDIGFPAARMSRAEETKLRMEYRQQLKDQPEIEKLSRSLQCTTNESFISVFD